MNPCPNEVKQYAMLSDAALLKHRLLMMVGNLPKPGGGNPRGAFDSMNAELARQLRSMTPAQKRAVRVAMDGSPSPQKSVATTTMDQEETRDPNYSESENDTTQDDNEEYDHGKVGELLQFLHDRLAGTALVDAKRGNG
jgi:hypothetical protein